MNIFNIDLNADALSAKNLIEFAETKAVTGNILKEYIVSILLKDDNVLARVCEKTEAIGDSLRFMALEDVHALWGEFSRGVLADYVPSVKRNLFFREYQCSLAFIVATKTPEEMTAALIAHYSVFGSGKEAGYIAFKWQHGLQGVEAPDAIVLDDLFCLDDQKKTLTENTVSFLRGLPANNVLLYGDSGSGKSSIVKALLNAYYGEGLRLAEIPKAAIDELPRLIDSVKNKKFHYIIFMDDLSFEEDETGYKNLKVVLEGQIERQPGNILLYATSNRRRLVSETWAERQGADVHVRDTMNEKLSLSQRFGLRIHFGTPGQDEYFQIIEGLLAKGGIALTDEIKAEAVRWELSHDGRSGRAAAQFVKQFPAR